ncbi:MAG: hypothetical protein U0359_16470 [Byssovorax sp.]
MRALLAALFAVPLVACSSGTSGGAGGGSSSSATSAGSGGGASTGGSSSSSGGASSSSSSGGLVTYGDPYEGGQFHLGPVDYAETAFHNACAPGTGYDPKVQQAEGTLLAGIWNGINDVSSYCDACIWVTTKKGKSALLRVVTYGETSDNSIDVSPDAFALLDSGEYPRSMSWQFAKCPETGPIYYEVQTGSSEWWTSLWVRNARVPLAKVEVKSENHPSFIELSRGGDGTLTDAGGFGVGPFTLRSTGMDGQVVTDTFDWPAGGIAGAFLTGNGNFP